MTYSGRKAAALGGSIEVRAVADHQRLRVPCHSRLDPLEGQPVGPDPVDTRSAASREFVASKSIHVDDQLGRSSVPRKAREFWVTIQNPRQSALDLIERSLGRRWGHRLPITIDAIEVAVDWFSKQSSELARWQMVAALFRHHFPVDLAVRTSRGDLRQMWNEKPEFVLPRPQGTTRNSSDWDSEDPVVRKRILRDRKEFEHYLDATVYLGADEGPVMFRIQNKVQELEELEAGTVKSLEPHQRRARIEVMLSGEPLDRHSLLTLDDLRHFGFENLRKPYFQFWFPTERPFRPDSLPARTRLFREGGIYSHELYGRATGRQKAVAQSRAGRGPTSRRGTGKTTCLVAWADLNEQAETRPEGPDRMLALTHPRCRGVGFSHPNANCIFFKFLVRGEVLI